jgi:hypothetical protein
MNRGGMRRKRMEEAENVTLVVLVYYIQLIIYKVACSTFSIIIVHVTMRLIDTVP